MCKTTTGYKIQKLENSFYFGIEHVLILILEKSCKLICLHNNRCISCVDYNTIRGAKIAFGKEIKHLISDDLKKKIGRPLAKWTQPYSPDSEWLQNILALCQEKG